MKYKTIYLFVCLLFATAISNAQKFIIGIVQDTLVTPVNGEVFIAKKPFAIEVTLDGIEGVYLYASFRHTIFRLSPTDTIPGFADLPGMAMAEESFNKDKELIINDDGWAYWFYDPQQDWHRFDKEITQIDRKVIGRKTIQQFYFAAKEKAQKVKDVAAPLYLFFVSAGLGENFNLNKEIQRFKIKINWQ
jgi:hypothetical protein